MNAQSTRRRTQRVATQTAELAMAVPQVVAMRLTQMALAGPKPSAADLREFHLMTSEKTAAAVESWTAMGLQMWRAQQELMLSCWRPWNPFQPGVSSVRAMQHSANAMHSATMGVIGEGLEPVRRRAVANAKRLTGR
jgi:hypothetical protein